MYNAKERILKVNDGEICCVSFGRGPRSLVMIQGLNTRGIRGSSAMLVFMYRIFAKDFTVFLFDRRADVVEGITVRELAADVAAAMDALGIARASVFGVSQGGMIAQYLAIDRPDLVDRLVLAVTLSRSNAVVEDAINTWIELTERNDMPALVADMASRMYSDAYMARYRPLLPLLTRLQEPKDKRRFVALARACLTCDTYEMLDEISCPTFVLGGLQDKVVGGEASVELAGKLGCELYLYENLGHAAYEEARDFNGRVYGFLMS